MSFIADVNNRISTLNSTTALLGSGQTFTGAWEEVINFSTAGVAIFADTPTDGTLYFDVSTDGGGTYISVSSTVSDTTLVVPRILNIVESHIRIRYVNGTTAQTGVFKLQTKFSVEQELGLLSAIEGTVTGETPTQVAKAIVVAKDPNGNYVNAAADGFVAVASTTTPLGAAGTFDSGIIDINGHQQIITDILSDQDGTLVGEWYNDAAGTDLTRTFTVPYNAANGYVYFSAPIFGRYLRYVYTNGGTPQTDFSLNTKLTTKAISGQILGINSFIPDNVVANLSRCVGVGQNPNGVFENIPSAGIDNNNTTSTPLGVSGTYTGTWTKVSSFGEIKVAMTTDQDPATCYFQLSHNGVTVDTSLNLPPQLNEVTGKYTFIHSLNPSLPYFRIVYTNGTVAQTEFKLTTLLLVESGNGFISRATAVLDRFTDVKNIRQVNNPEQDRNFGLINYQEAVRIRGKNPNIAAGSQQTVWTHSANYVIPTTAETIRVRAGGNAADTAAGAGARTIKVLAVLDDWTEKEITLTLAGASASAPSVELVRAINLATVETVGTFGGANTGNIIIENTSALQVLAHVGAGDGQSKQAIYTVPLNFTVWVDAIDLSVGQSDSANVIINHVKDASQALAPKVEEWSVRDFSGAAIADRKTFLKFPEKSVIYVTAERITGSGSANVAVELEVIKTDNTI